MSPPQVLSLSPCQSPDKVKRFPVRHWFQCWCRSVGPGSVSIPGPVPMPGASLYPGSTSRGCQSPVELHPLLPNPGLIPEPVLVPTLVSAPMSRASLHSSAGPQKSEFRSRNHPYPGADTIPARCQSLSQFQSRSRRRSLCLEAVSIPEPVPMTRSSPDPGAVPSIPFPDPAHRLSRGRARSRRTPGASAALMASGGGTRAPPGSFSPPPGPPLPPRLPRSRPGPARHSPGSSAARGEPGCPRSV